MAETVLHLIDGAGSQASPATLGLLALTLDVPGVRPRVLLWGRAGLARAAETAGLSGADQLRPPAQRLLLGGPGLSRRIRLRGEPGLIHCWSVGAFEAAALIRPRTPSVLTLTQPMDEPGLRRLQRLSRRAGPHRRAILITDSAMREPLTRAGLDHRTIHMADPPVEPGWIASGKQRDALRQRWGVDESTRLIALLSDPPAAADAYAGALALGLAKEGLTQENAREGQGDQEGEGELPKAPALALLVHPDQHHRPRAEQMLDPLGNPVGLIQAPEMAASWEMLPGCDTVLAVDEHGAGLPLRWALAHDRPIVAAPTSQAQRQIPPDHPRALLAAGEQPRDLAHQLHRLFSGAAAETVQPHSASESYEVEEQWRWRVAHIYEAVRRGRAEAMAGG